MKYLISIIVLLLCGCFSLDFSTPKNSQQVVDTIAIASPLNVYRTATNIITRVKVQNKKGEWVEYPHPILIPTNWYIVSGVGIEEN